MKGAWAPLAPPKSAPGYYSFTSLYSCTYVANSCFLIVVTEMPVDTVCSLIGKAIDVIGWIIDRLNQLKLTDDVAARISEMLKYLQMTIHKIRSHLKQDSDTKEIKQFLALLENSSQLCAHISERT